jgi:hypothetical protein
MVDEAWKEFLHDDMTWKAFNDSEVFREYAKRELQREASRKLGEKEARLDEEARLLKQLDDFQEKLEANPELLTRLKRAKAALEANPELAKQVDPSFITGIKLLNLED